MKFTKSILVPNAAELADTSPELFTLIRRGYFGASDSSILLNVNPYRNLNDLLVEKQSPTMTDEEIELSEKPAIRMGRDMEPIILQKFIDMTSIVAVKPEPMYRLGDTKLTVNYDALTQDDVPVEIKCISYFGDKKWNWDKAYEHHLQSCKCNNLRDKIVTQADMIGIPVYYYTQVQQQLMGVQAHQAYLAAFSTKEWQLYYFLVDEDEEIQEAIWEASVLNDINVEQEVLPPDNDDKPDWF